MKSKRVFINCAPFFMATIFMFTGAGLFGTDTNGSVSAHEFHNYLDTVPEGDFMADQYTDYTAQLSAKADTLCARYIENATAVYKQLKGLPYMGRSYVTKVKKEIPQAPVGKHCMFSQYTHLQRALDALNDTLMLIPAVGSAGNPRAACRAFKSEMRNKYSGKEFQNCIHEGKMYASDAEFAAALEKCSAGLSDSVRQAKQEKFNKSNFSAEKLNPGTILIVPRRSGSVREFHAIMYLGRGRLDSAGNFIASASGEHMFIANNRESIGEVFKTWDTRNVFAADIKNIAIALYAQELARIQNMGRDELIEYLSDCGLALHGVSDVMLKELAVAKYFGQDVKEIVQCLQNFKIPDSAYGLTK